MNPYVKNYQKEGIGYIEFGHPAGNSLPSTLLYQISEKMRLLNTDVGVRVIVLKSHGHKAFCGGASLSELKDIKAIADAKAFFMGFASVINTMRALDKFIVVQVQGKAVGGATGIIAASDYAIAHNDAAIKLSELSIGIGPYVIEPALSRKMGTTAFTQLSLDSHEWKSADWALQQGLYAKVCPTHKTLESTVNAFASRLASYAPEAMKELKKLHWKNTEHWDELLPKNAEITGKLALSPFTQNILNKL